MNMSLMLHPHDFYSPFLSPLPPPTLFKRKKKNASSLFLPQKKEKPRTRI
jgi:hypothetical protein